MNPNIWHEVENAVWARNNMQGYTIRRDKEKGVMSITFSPETFTFDLSVPGDAKTFARNLLQAIEDFQERMQEG